MEQSREEMHEKIRKASDRKILRRQMELLAEYSRTCGIISIHTPLAECDYVAYLQFLQQ